MKNITAFFVLIICSIALYGQTFIAHNILTNYPIDSITPKLEGYFSNHTTAKHPVTSYKLQYNSINHKGEKVQLSGAVYLPKNTPCRSLPTLLLAHETTFSAANVPSTDFNGNYGQVMLRTALYFANRGYIVVLPDYIGMGDDSTTRHFYIHKQTQADACLDALRATWEMINIPEFIDIAYNNQLFMTGYSQGGHVIASTHEKIEKNNLQNEFNVVASAPCSGPYDLSNSQFKMMFNAEDRYRANAFTVYNIMAYQDVYGDIFSSLDDFFKPRFANVVRNLWGDRYKPDLNWYFSLPQHYRLIIKDVYVDSIKNPNQRGEMAIYKHLVENNAYNWTTKTPVRFFYCSNDTLVSPKSSKMAADTMTKMGSPNVRAIEVSDGNHNTCFVPSMEKTFDWFQSFKKICNSKKTPHKNTLYLYPNPSQAFVYIVNLKDKSHYKLYKSTGQNIPIEWITKNSFSIKNLQKGVYIVCNTKTNRTKKIIKQ